MKKQRYAILLCAAVLLFLLSGCLRPISYAETLKANWDLTIPSGYTILYETDTGASFHGDGVRYDVLEYEDDSVLEDLADWREEQLPTRYADSETQAAEECLSRLDVPAEWEIPDGDCRYDCIIKDNCEMLLFWHTPDRRLYIVQNLV